MAFMEISIVPLGTGSASLGDYVAEAVKVLNDSGLKYILSDMGAIVEGTPTELFSIAQKMHESVFSKGIMRAYTVIKIDDRRDRVMHLGQKIDSLKKRMQ